jgi:hypothetical protein
MLRLQPSKPPFARTFLSYTLKVAEEEGHQSLRVRRISLIL